MPLTTVMNGVPRTHAIERVCAKFRSLDEGDFVSHNDLARIVGERYGSQRYYGIVNSACTRCQRDDGFVMRNVQGDGYERANGPEQLRESAKYTGRAIRSQDRARRMAETISDERLPLKEHRDARDFIVQRSNYMVALMRGDRKALNVQLDPPQVLPQKRQRA